MQTLKSFDRRLSMIGAILALLVLLPLGSLWSAEPPMQTPLERKEAVSLADAVIRALQNNLDISISRQTKESRLTDIVFEQAKFDQFSVVRDRILIKSPPLISEISLSLLT